MNSGPTVLGRLSSITVLSIGLETTSFFQSLTVNDHGPQLSPSLRWGGGWGDGI